MIFIRYVLVLKVNGAFQTLLENGQVRIPEKRIMDVLEIDEINMDLLKRPLDDLVVVAGFALIEDLQQDLKKFQQS